MKLSRFTIFFSVLSVLLFFVWGIVWLRLIVELDLSQDATFVAAVIFITTYCLQILRFIQFQEGKSSPKLLFVTYFCFGYAIYLLFAALAKDVVVTLFALSDQQVASIVAILIGTVVNCWGVFTAFSGPKIKHVQINITEKFNHLIGLRIAQVSDLHVGPLIKSKYVTKMTTSIAAVNPNLIVYTGDIGDGHATHYAKELEPLRALTPSHGSFFVTGNHEYFWNAEEWILAVQKLGIQPLINSGEQITFGGSNFWLGGVTDYMAAYFDPIQKPNFENALKTTLGETYKILLAHQPKAYREAEQFGTNLMLCGHTHRGQFFPFNLLVGFFNPFTHGLNFYKNLQIYVNVGSGFWGPPLRLGVPSEVTLLEFVGT